MSAIEIIDALHPTFENPAVVAGAGVAAVSGVVADLGIQNIRARIQRDQAERRVTIADPDSAREIKAHARRQQRRSRLQFYAATAFVTFGLVHLAGPHAAGDEKGGVSEVIDVSYAQEVKDVKDANGQTVSRSDASIEGGLAAAEEVDQPFSYIVEGSKPQLIDQTSGDNLSQTIEASITPDLQNGESLADATAEARSLDGSNNKVVIVASSIGNKEDKADLRSMNLNGQSASQTRHESAVYAIVVGKNDRNYRLGNKVIPAPVDTQAFEDLLGSENVKTAQSSNEVKEAIKEIASQEVVTSKKHKTNFYGYLALLSATVGSGIGIRRHTAGLIGALKSKERK